VPEPAAPRRMKRSASSAAVPREGDNWLAIAGSSPIHEPSIASFLPTPGLQKGEQSREPEIFAGGDEDGMQFGRLTMGRVF